MDLNYLVEQRRMLSKTEYANKMLPQPYDRYREVYYQRRLVDLFEELRGQIWFVDRYLGDMPAIRPEVPATMRFVLIENIPYGMSRLDAMNCFGGYDGVVSIYITQNGVRRQYRRDVYVNISDNCDANELMSAIGGQPHFLDLSKREIEEVCRVTLAEARGILGNLAGSQADEQDDAGKITRRLREEFLYCVTCSRQFDNYATMMRCCSSHAESDFSQRNIEIASTPRDLGSVVYTDDDAEIASFIIRTPESTFKCRSCQKLFEGFDFARNHLSAKHPDIILEIQSKRENFYKFIKNIDVFMLEVVEGTADGGVPHFGRSRTNSGAVVYDFPCLFSGDIRIHASD